MKQLIFWGQQMKFIKYSICDTTSSLLLLQRITREFMQEQDPSDPEELYYTITILRSTYRKLFFRILNKG